MGTYFESLNSNPILHQQGAIASRIFSETQEESQQQIAGSGLGHLSTEPYMIVPEPQYRPQHMVILIYKYLCIFYPDI